MLGPEQTIDGRCETDNMCGKSDEVRAEKTALTEHGIVYELSDEILGLLKDDMSRHAFKQFKGIAANRDRTGDGSFVDGSIKWPTRLDAWIATVAECLTEKESRGGHQPKLYSINTESTW